MQMVSNLHHLSRSWNSGSNKQQPAAKIYLDVYFESLPVRFAQVTWRKRQTKNNSSTVSEVTQQLSLVTLHTPQAAESY